MQDGSGAQAGTNTSATSSGGGAGVNVNDGALGNGGATPSTGGSAGARASDSSVGGGAVPATFDTVKTVLQGGGPFTPCASAPCHGVGGMAPPGNPLTLAINDQLYTNLTSHISKDCGSIPVVNAGKPDQSALVKVLEGPCSAVTPRMPLGCSDTDGNCIPADYIAAIAKWIAIGAPKQ